MTSWWKLNDRFAIDFSKKSTTYNNLSQRKGGAPTVRYIVVHYTGNGHANDYPSTARNCCIYFNGGNRSSSADFFIDDSGIYRYNPSCSRYYSWHCGDGHGKNGITNANSIGIEVVSSGEDFTTKEKRQLRWLVRKLMKKYGIPASRVVRHYDASGKRCPWMHSGSAVNDAKWKVLRAHITKTY